MKLVKLLIKLAVGLIGFLAIVFVLAGILIPSERSFTLETEINASHETVWSVLTDREKYTEWQDKISGVEIKDDENWVEISKDAGPIDFKYVKREKPTLLELSYSTPSGVNGEWRGELRSAGEGKTIVTTTDKSVVKSWIAKVFMSMFFDIEDFARDWNQKLKKRAEAVEAQKQENQGE